MLKTLTVGALEVNCYVLSDDSSKEAVIIDPGGDAQAIISVVKKNGFKVRWIVNTHGHFDHVGADEELRRVFNCPVAMHGVDVDMLLEAHEHGVIFGVKTEPQKRPDVILEDGSLINAGGITLRVIHTPGHTRGGVCLYDEAGGRLFTGDTLFAGSVGRTDLDGGSFAVIMDSIRNKILPLGHAVKVYPGHGDATTIGKEEKTNPYITGEAGG
ncbi:MAG: MBL fold metallo-hydrolase [Deltaproteobacteria bacterium]|nr:MBL fold metallo-hydrolase [Deltaproteobacteria bacterium]